MKNKYFMLLLSLSLLFAGSFSVRAGTNKIVAKVNGEVITSADLKKYQQMLIAKRSERSSPAKGKDDLYSRALNRLIEDRLILQAAEKAEIEVPDSWLEQKINQLASSYSGREEFYRSLQKEGLTMSMLKQRLKDQYLMREVIDRNVKAFVSVAPGQISKYYEKNKESFVLPSQAVFFTAKAPAKSRLEEIGKSIDKEGIEKAQKKYPQMLSKVESPLPQLQEPIKDALLAAADAGYSIKKIGDTFFLIYRQEIIPARSCPFSEIQEDVYQHLWQKTFAREFDNWVEGLKSDAVIMIYSQENYQEE